MYENCPFQTMWCLSYFCFYFNLFPERQDLYNFTREGEAFAGKELIVSRSFLYLVCLPAADEISFLWSSGELFV